MHDPLSVVNAPFYIGLFSNIGIILWASSAAICFFTVAIFWKNCKAVKSTSFLFFSGIITSVLLLDDFFILHESAFPDYLHIPQSIVLVTYAIIMLTYIYIFKKEILHTEFVILLICLLFFSYSALIDQTDYFYLWKKALFEDGAKLLGIVSWFIYFTRVCMREINSVIYFVKPVI